MFRTIAAAIATVLALGIAGPASAGDASCPDATRPCPNPAPCDASTCPPLAPAVCDASNPCANATEAGPTVKAVKVKRHRWAKAHRAGGRTSDKAQRQVTRLNAS